MNGRTEHEVIFNNRVSSISEKMPEFVQEWIDNLDAGGKTGATRSVFARIIRRFLESINENMSEVNLTDLSFNKTQKYFISIKKKYNGESTSDSYQQQVWCCLNNFFSFLVKRKYIDSNPMDAIDKPKNHDLDRINENRILLTENDFNKIIRSVKNGVGSGKAQTRQEKFRNRDLSIVLLFMVTGMRKTALTEINVNDINIETGVLKVIDKGDKLQVYYLSEDVISIIKNWISDREELGLNNSESLFVSYQGRRLSGTAIDDLIGKYCEDALGKHISPHKLRAGFVSIYYKKTKDIEATRRAVGHSSVSTTSRYIVTENDERKNAANYIASSLKF